jgi:hypothetical protein
MHDDLEPVANLRIAKAFEEVSAEARDRLAELRNQAAAKGSLLSGRTEMAEFDHQVAVVQRVARVISDTWVDLITQKKHALTRDDLTLIMQKVERYTTSEAKALWVWMINRPGGSIIPDEHMFWEDQAKNRMRKTAGDIWRDLEILFRERELFPRETRKPDTMPHTTHINIENANIANLNLGNQVGTINTALQVLSSENHQAVADALKELTDHVLQDERLEGNQKQEAVEALTTLATEAKQGPGHASVSVKALISWLPKVLAVSADLVTLWDKFGPILRGYFGI